MEFEVNAQEDPYSALEEACKLDLLEMAQANEENTKSTAVSKSASLYLHPIKARVQELKVRSKYCMLYCYLNWFCGCVVYEIGTMPQPDVLHDLHSLMLQYRYHEYI